MDRNEPLDGAVRYRTSVPRVLHKCCLFRASNQVSCETRVIVNNNNNIAAKII